MEDTTSGIMGGSGKSGFLSLKAAVGLPLCPLEWRDGTYDGTSFYVLTRLSCDNDTLLYRRRGRHWSLYCTHVLVGAGLCPLEWRDLGAAMYRTLTFLVVATTVKTHTATPSPDTASRVSILGWGSHLSHSVPALAPPARKRPVCLICARLGIVLCEGDAFIVETTRSLHLLFVPLSLWLPFPPFTPS